MKIALFTSTSLRHKYIANQLGSCHETLVVSEKKTPSITSAGATSPLATEHFRKRDETEKIFFSEYAEFNTSNIVHIERGAVNSEEVFEKVREFAPEAAVVFGASRIGESLLSFIPHGRFINIHLGLSPYYRGSGTNFWPFVNKELEYLGATIHHLDVGLDTGEIIQHVLPDFTETDNVHTIGCKLIRKCLEALKQQLKRLDAGHPLNRTPQWATSVSRYYRNKDFTDDAIRTYLNNLSEGVVVDFVHSHKHYPTLIFPSNGQ